MHHSQPGPGPGPGAEGETAAGRYTNFGVPEFAADHLFRLCMDTYYVGGTALEVGRIALGEGPIRADTGLAAFALAQLATLRGAFDALLRPFAVTAWHKPTLEGVRTLISHLGSPDHPGDLARIDFRELAALADPVVGLGLECFVRLAVRDAQCAPAEAWFYGASVFLQAAYSDGTSTRHPHLPMAVWGVTPRAREGFAPWTARLALEGTLPLFRRDNAEVLARVRRLWRERRAADPAATGLNDGRDEDDWLEEGEIVTLADPPLGGPADNADLHARNAPRLLEAIARWEAATGLPFAWTPDWRKAVG